jgi:hypothetical protein
MGLTSPTTRAPGYKVLSTNWNEFVDNFVYMFTNTRGISFTPTWTTTTGTAPSLGNGTLTGTYCRHGKLVWIKIALVAGSTTTFGNGGLFQFALPITAQDTTDQFSAVFVDASAQFYSATGIMKSTGLVTATWTGDVSAGGPAFNLPFTWAVNDQLRISGWYLASAD